MSDNVADAGSSRVARRGFMKVIGATGLGVAALAVGRSAPAKASNPPGTGCCSFVIPPNVSYSYCEQYAHTWSCSEDGGYLYCNCCQGCGLAGYQCQYDAAGREVRIESSHVGQPPRPLC